MKQAFIDRALSDDTLSLDDMTLDYLSESYAATATSSIRWFLEAGDKQALNVIEDVTRRRDESPAYGFMGVPFSPLPGISRQ